MSKRGSLYVAREQVVGASAETVWALVGDFNGWDGWHPAIQGSTITEGANNQPGGVRQLALGGKATIDERLTQYSAADKRYTYIILAGVMPVDGYASTLEVQSAGEGQARIVWEGSFEAKGVSDDAAIKAIEGVYESGLAALRERFG